MSPELQVTAAPERGKPTLTPHYNAYIAEETLHIVGTGPDSDLTLRLQAAVPTMLELYIGDEAWPDFRFDRAQFERIVVAAADGNDVVRIDESNGVFTDTEATTIDGGGGDDTLVGGSGGERFNGGPGADSMHLGAGNDTFEWHPGDGTDFVEGGDGIDTVEVNGSDGAEEFTITANGARVRFDRINPTPFFLDIGTCENLVLSANDGGDTLACTGNLAALIKITADGGPGDDTLRGSNGVDVLIGGDDNDFVDGNQGNDVAFLGAGDDVFQWDPGDGSDTVEGQAGADTLVFNGSGANEIMDVSANGGRLRFTRNVGNIVMDLDDVEQLDVRALGGTDTVNVNDLTGTDAARINVDLAGTLGGNTGDGQADAVVVNGTELPDTIHIAAVAGEVVVGGLAAEVRIAHPERANDRLTVNGRGGMDTITVGPGVEDLIMLTINE
ncbi:MAG: hypothetical protein AB1716_09695 [Planctomycetota bacterium]